MSDVKTKPLVGVVCDRKIIDPHPFHVVGEKYIKALADAADVIPVLIPSLGADYDVAEWLSALDGLFLTGAYSMVEPARYQQPNPDGMELDPYRDSASFSAIDYALKAGLPILGVCRGFQELVVATGGSLNAEIHNDSRYHDHREDKNQTLEEQYAKAHSVDTSEGGLLRKITGQQSFQVNSLHVQGAEALGQSAVVEAVADDGLVEAISVKDSPAFSLAVQWHPEWKVLEDDASTKIFKAFGDACRAKLKQ